MAEHVDDKCVNKAGHDPLTGDAGGTLNMLLKMFFQHQIIIKMAHFATNSYAMHKATDGYLEKFEPNFDRFMEVLQGAIGKPTQPFTLDQIPIHKTPNDLSDHLRSFRKEIYKLSCKIKHMPDLNAIRDEIMADVEQLIYLLTFE